MTTDPSDRSPDESVDQTADQLPPLEDQETEVLEQDVEGRYPDEPDGDGPGTAEMPNPHPEDPDPAIPPPRSA